MFFLKEKKKKSFSFAHAKKTGTACTELFPETSLNEHSLFPYLITESSLYQPLKVTFYDTWYTSGK